MVCGFSLAVDSFCLRRLDRVVVKPFAYDFRRKARIFSLEACRQIREWHRTNICTHVPYGNSWDLPQGHANHFGLVRMLLNMHTRISLLMESSHENDYIHTCFNRHPFNLRFMARECCCCCLKNKSI